jgi:heat shock protein HslJ
VYNKTNRKGPGKKTALAGAILLTLLCACAGQQNLRPNGPPPSFDLIREREWKLVEIRVENRRTDFNRKVLDKEFPTFYTLIFEEEMFFGRAAPNNYRGPYVVSGAQGLSFSMLAATLMAPLGEPAADLGEYEFFKFLEYVYRWDLRNGKLELYTKDKDGKDSVLTFSE